MNQFTVFYSDDSYSSKLIKVIGTILIVTCIISLMFNIYTVYKKKYFYIFLHHTLVFLKKVIIGKSYVKR